MCVVIAGEEADLPELHGTEGAGVDHGVPHPIHQGRQAFSSLKFCLPFVHHTTVWNFFFFVNVT
jgi:hypothetical protein